MDPKRKQILRYAELALRHERIRREIAKDKKEMDKIKSELGMDHNTIIELARKKLVPE